MIRFRFIACCLVLLFFVHAPVFAAEDTVQLKFVADSAAFPQNPFDAPTSTSPSTYETAPLAESEQARCTGIVREELRKYPKELLKSILSSIYVVSELKFHGTVIGGINFRQTRSICVCASPGCTDGYMARIVDHELIHLLVSDRYTRFPRHEWTRLNPPDFQYGPGGLESIKAGMTAGDGNDSVRAQGFARPYGKSDLGEDVACIGEMLFSGDQEWWRSVDRFPLLRSKVDALCAYLTKLDSRLTVEFFRMMPESRFASSISRYREGEVVYFPDGGKIVSPSDPLRIVHVDAGACALFPARSHIQFDTRPTNGVPEPESGILHSQRPETLPGYTLVPGPHGGWMLVAEQDRPTVGQRRGPICRPGNVIYFNYGGRIYEPTKDDPVTVEANRIVRYPAGSIVLFSPRLHPE